MQILDRLFLAHPRTVGESYLEHCAFAFRIGSRLLLAGSAALVHAAVPLPVRDHRVAHHPRHERRHRRPTRPGPCAAHPTQAKEPLFGFAEYI